MRSLISRTGCALILLLLAMVALSAQDVQHKVDTLEQQAQKYLQEQKPQSAIPVLREIVALDPKNVNGQANLGVLLYFQDNYAEAIPHMTAALQLQPDLYRIEALLGIAEKRTGDPVKARADLEHAFANLDENKIRIDAGLALIELDSASAQFAKALSVAAKRWEGNTGWSDVHGNDRSFDPNILNPATNAPGAMWYGVTAANGRTSLQKGVWNNWLPRIGFAYQLGAKTVIRGGFGMYTYPWNVDTYASGGLGNAFTASGNQTDSTNNAYPVVLLSSNGSTNYQGSKGSAINSLYQPAPTGPAAYNGQAVGFNQYTSPVPLLKSWNVTVQRQLTSNLVADVAYIGSHGNHLAFLTDLNQVPQNLLGPNDAANRPYPKFQSLTGYTTQGISNYDALQAEVTRRFSNGLMFNFNYTWSHMLDNQDSSGWGSLQGATPYQNAYVPSANYGDSNFDVRHQFKGQGAYDIPVGLGRQFLNHNKALDEVIGGWTLFGDLITQTGSPFTPYMATNNSYSQSSNSLWYPNVVGNPTAVSGGQNIYNWFNVSAFAAPAPGTFGNMGRNTVFGPPLTAVNSSLHKIFTITERVRLDFSANATNLLNHPSFALPDKLIGPGHFGQITGVSVASRQMELIVKVRF